MIFMATLLVPSTFKACLPTMTVVPYGIEISAVVVMSRKTLLLAPSSRILFFYAAESTAITGRRILLVRQTHMDAPLRHFSGRSFTEHARKNVETSSITIPRSITQPSAAKSTNIQVTAGGVAALLVGAVLSARFLYGQLLNEEVGSDNTRLRSDASLTRVLIVKPVDKAPATLSQEYASPRLQKVDAAEFNTFVEQQRHLLQHHAQRVHKEASIVLQSELEKAFADPHDRVAKFASWYLSYPTTYKFLGLATSSAVAHAVTLRKEQTLTARVIQDLQEHVYRKYEALVLRPARTDPRIHQAMVEAVRVAHQGYQDALGSLESSLADFIAEQAKPYYGEKPTAQDIVIEMDWRAQVQKVQHIPVQYEKTPTVALVATGAVAGKLASSGTGLAATKALSAKLMAPFATKAAGTALAGKAASGATAGAIMGGPLGGVAGAITGAAVGIGLDMTVNAGVALMQRSTLEQDVHEAIDATRLEWESCLQAELDRVHATWFDHAAAVLKPNADEKVYQSASARAPDVSVFENKGSAKEGGPAEEGSAC